MRIWTIQNADVVQIIERQGAYWFDPRFIADSFVSNPVPAGYDPVARVLFNAYQWMASKLATKHTPPSHLPRPMIEAVEYPMPIWGWRKAETNKCRPDLRSHRHNETGLKVLLTLEVPNEHLLLTDFVSWHTVLNGGTDPHGKYSCLNMRGNKALVQAVFWQILAEHIIERPVYFEGRVDKSKSNPK